MSQPPPRADGLPIAGTRMVREGRRRAIVEYVARRGSASVTELTRLLSASAGTVRTDLEVLDADGVLVRTRGGAVAASGFSLREPPSGERLHEQAAEKMAIARRAVEHYVEDGDAILLDAGTTTLAMANELVAGHRSIMAITNSLDAATILSSAPDVTLVVTGGEYRRGIASLVGVWLEHALSTIRVRSLFLGANAVSPTAGVTTPNLQEAAGKRAMITAAEQVILLVDHTKLNRTTLGYVAPLDEIDAIVTDDRADSAAVNAIRSLDVRVDLAPVDPAAGARHGTA